NTVYAALDYMFKDLGYTNVFMGTVEAYPDFPTMLKMVKAFSPKKITLAPFMIVAGDHATNDMAGEDDDAWQNLLKKEGFGVECQLKGLGEYPKIRKIFVNHALNAVNIK
ncbi:MAG: sirohydrochlorin cobaltochelatase, partial [Clostridiales bacterium]